MPESLQRYKITVNLAKSGDMIYISQLDVNRLLIRAARRAKLPLYYTQGYNPHPKLSFSNALKLGVEGSFQVTFHLVEDLNVFEFITRLQSQLPGGIAITVYDKMQGV